MFVHQNNYHECNNRDSVSQDDTLNHPEEPLPELEKCDSEYDLSDNTPDRNEGYRPSDMELAMVFIKGYRHLKPTDSEGHRPSDEELARAFFAAYRHVEPTEEDGTVTQEKKETVKKEYTSPSSSLTNNVNTDNSSERSASVDYPTSKKGGGVSTFAGNNLVGTPPTRQPITPHPPTHQNTYEIDNIVREYLTSDLSVNKLYGFFCAVTQNRKATLYHDNGRFVNSYILMRTHKDQPIATVPFTITPRAELLKSLCIQTLDYTNSKDWIHQFVPPTVWGQILMIIREAYSKFYRQICLGHGKNVVPGSTYNTSTESLILNGDDYKTTSVILEHMLDFPALIECTRLVFKKQQHATVDTYTTRAGVESMIFQDAKSYSRLDVLLDHVGMRVYDSIRVHERYLDTSIESTMWGGT